MTIGQAKQILKEAQENPKAHPIAKVKEALKIVANNWGNVPQ